jgi:hypothetical protein
VEKSGESRKNNRYGRVNSNTSSAIAFNFHFKADAKGN